MTSNRPFVLILNHQPEIVRLLSSIVDDLGFAWATFAGGSDWLRPEGYQAILAYIQERQPDFIVFDMPPPYRDAIEIVTRLVSDLDSGIKWVFISTSDEALAIVEGSGHRTLRKPFDTDELARLLT